jgi:hypothetical protein
VERRVEWELRPEGGELAGIRTQDPRLKRALLYQLSYELVQGRFFQATICEEAGGAAAARSSQKEADSCREV